MTDFKVGDRVVVESPIFCDATAEHRSDWIDVGDTGTVTDIIDYQGDYLVDFGVGRETYVHATGLLKVSDLDALAAERAPRRVRADEAFEAILRHSARQNAADERATALDRAGEILSAVVYADDPEHGGEGFDDVATANALVILADFILSGRRDV